MGHFKATNTTGILVQFALQNKQFCYLTNEHGRVLLRMNCDIGFLLKLTQNALEEILLPSPKDLGLLALHLSNARSVSPEIHSWLHHYFGSKAAIVRWLYFPPSKFLTQKLKSVLYYADYWLWFYCFARCYSLFYPPVILGSFLFVLYIFVPIGACILEDLSSFFHILMRSCSCSKREKRT